MNVINYDLLAWIIVACFYVFIILPMVGTVLGKRGKKYTSNLYAGLLLNVFVIVCAAVISPIVWAFLHIAK